MNPALPGGALIEASSDETSWSTDARLGYAFIPYGRLQQGRSSAPNPNELAIDVHLATLQLSISAPTKTRLDLQLPAGTLITSTFDQRRTDSGIGDLEARVRQSVLRIGSSRPLTVGATLGLVVPTGPYVARSGAANLAPEASYLTLGRGTEWWLAELDARLRVGRTALFSQVAGRGPLARTEDGFAWGPEFRITAGVQHGVVPWLSLIVATDLQVRGGASEPDPFSSSRLMAANAGGWQWTIAPACSVVVTRDLSFVVGARAPIVSDVTGNQLVPQIGGFVALSYTRSMSRPRVPTPRPDVSPVAGRITVVDYWATWCKPCGEISSALAVAASRWPDVVIVKVDATEWPDGPSLPTGATGLPVVEVFDASGKRHALLLGRDALRVVDEVDALRETKKGTPK